LGFQVLKNCQHCPQNKGVEGSSFIGQLKDGGIWNELSEPNSVVSAL